MKCSFFLETFLLCGFLQYHHFAGSPCTSFCLGLLPLLLRLSLQGSSTNNHSITSYCIVDISIYVLAVLIVLSHSGLSSECLGCLKLSLFFDSSTDIHLAFWLLSNCFLFLSLPYILPLWEYQSHISGLDYFCGSPTEFFRIIFVILGLELFYSLDPDEVSIGHTPKDNGSLFWNFSVANSSAVRGPISLSLCFSSMSPLQFRCQSSNKVLWDLTPFCLSLEHLSKLIWGPKRVAQQ